ncbi:MAG: hypothetical protein AAF211_13675 [Myxococcota bacterium]
MPRHLVVASLSTLLACSEYSLSNDDRFPAPDLVLDPPELDFGVVEAGSSRDLAVTLTNVGNAELQIGQSTADHLAFAVSARAYFALQPGEQAEATVTYVPTAPSDEGRVLFETNLAETPLAELPVRGLRGGELPVALCDVDPPEVLTLHETATWLGGDSFDDGGSALTYEWTLIGRPEGSSATMPAGSDTSPDRPGFVADLVGTYTGQLVVTDDRGVSSDPCSVDLEAVPATELWVEMFWERNLDDMDLHVVRGDGTLESDDDCHWANCRSPGLRWSPSGPDGDPVLDIDDITGTGPENVNIAGPADQLYHVWVHDYPESERNAGNDVTVRIYLSGAIAFDETRTLSGEDDFEHFATIDWATQTVTSE